MRTRILICVAWLGLSGCAVNERISYTDSEGNLPKDVLERIQDNQTTKAWVVSHLGDPFAIDRVEYSSDDNVDLHEVYTWRLVRSKIRSGHALFVFRAGARQDEIDYFHVLFSDKVVKKSWMDQYAGVQLGIRENKKVILQLPSGDQPAQLETDENNGEFDWKLPILKKWFGGSAKKATEEQYSKVPEEMIKPKQASKKDADMPLPSTATETETIAAEPGELIVEDMEADKVEQVDDVDATGEDEMSFPEGEF